MLRHRLRHFSCPTGPICDFYGSLLLQFGIDISRGENVMRIWIILGGLNGLTAVIAGGYGYHSIEANSGAGDFFAMGVQYQIWHALALLAVAWLASNNTGGGRKVVNIAGFAFTGGIAMFSGTLYALALTGDVLVPGLAPTGGVLLMVGWCALITAGLKKK